MKVTFLEHSGFLAELPSVTLLFDWWKGELPAMRPDIPLLVFSSHAHHDHFRSDIFALDDGTRPVRFLLGSDIVLSPSNRAKWDISDSTAAACLRIGGGETAVPLPGVTVEALPSTDEGVAFLVSADGKTVFHAGDLNWWHWEGEPDPWNPDMEAAFKRYSEPLRGREIDLAMLPLDPRQETHGFLGAEYFLTLASIRKFIPMHQWGNFGFTEQFLACYPEFRKQALPVHQAGQVFQL